LDLRGRKWREAEEDCIMRSLYTWVIKSSVRLAGHVERIGEMKTAYKILIGKPEGKRKLERRRRRWGIILEWILRKLGDNLWTGFIWLRI
jgi:hypothetical protein